MTKLEYFISSVILSAISAAKAMVVGWFWHNGHTDAAMTFAVYFILEAISQMRDKMNDLHREKKPCTPTS